MAGIQAKQARYAELVREAGYLHGQLLADAWCAAFVWKKCKEPNRPYPILDDLVRKIEQNPYHCPPWMREEIGRLARQYQFFHWHLAFPEVFAQGGFDVVLGNPPWERVKLQEKEWFAERRPEIANAPNAAARKRLIEALKRAIRRCISSFRKIYARRKGKATSCAIAGVIRCAGGATSMCTRCLPRECGINSTPPGAWGACCRAGVIFQSQCQQNPLTPLIGLD